MGGFRESSRHRSVYRRYLEDARTVGREPQESRSLVESHLFYVVQLAREYRNLGIPLEDLLAEGNLGLLEAAARFDPGRGVKFVSYATWWIRKRILDLVARQIGIVRLPKHRLERLRRIRSAEKDLRNRFGRDPTVVEIARCCMLSVAEVEALQTQSQREVSLDTIVNAKSGLRLEETLAGPGAVSPDHDVVRRDFEALLGRHLERLPGRQREILAMHYGLDGCRPATLAEIGRRMGVSRERVRQLEIQGLVRLRRLMGEFDSAA